MIGQQLDGVGGAVAMLQRLCLLDPCSRTAWPAVGPRDLLQRGVLLARIVRLHSHGGQKLMASRVKTAAGGPRQRLWRGPRLRGVMGMVGSLRGLGGKST